MIPTELVTSDRRGEIYEEAQRVHNKAEGYQLAHSVFACDRLVYESVEELLREPMAKKEKLQLEKLRNKRANLDNELIALDEEISKIMQENPNHVYVRNFKGSEAATARVMRVDDRYFEIAVPEHMWQKCLPNSSGKYNKEAICSLRKAMAHEIGHVLLHPTSIVIDGTKKVGNQQAEANIFSEKLISLRNERRESQVNQGVYLL